MWIEPRPGPRWSFLRGVYCGGIIAVGTAPFAWHWMVLGLGVVMLVSHIVWPA